MPTFLTVDLTLFPERERHLPVRGCLTLAGMSGILGLCGPSGAGKSTFVRTLAGLHPRAAGQITMDGKAWLDSDKGIDLPFERRPVAYLPQEATLFPHMNVRENLLFAAVLAQGSKSGRHKMFGHPFGKWGRAAWRSPLPKTALNMVDLFGIGDLLEKKVDALSGGESMKVSLARCFLKTARLYLLDEPMTGIDPEGRRHLVRVVWTLLEARRAMGVWVTHSPDELVALAESMVFLPPGGGTLLVRNGNVPSLPNVQWTW